MRVTIRLYDDIPLSASVPKRVTCIVKEAHDHMKGIPTPPKWVLSFCKCFFIFYFLSSFSGQSYWGVNPVKKCSPLLISITCSFSFFFACFVEYNLRYMSCLIKYVTMWVLTCSDYDNSYKGLHYCQRSSFTIICVCGPYWCRYYCQKVHSHGC